MNDEASELRIRSLAGRCFQAKRERVQKKGITEPKSKVSAILLGRTTSQHKITFQSRLTSNHARRDRKLCPCHWDAGEKCKYPSPERTPHMHPGVPSIAPHLRVSILCQSCLFNTTLILSFFLPPTAVPLSQLKESTVAQCGLERHGEREKACGERNREEMEQ